MKTKHGDFICINWEYASDVEYVRGHVSLDEAKAAFEFWSGTEAGDAVKGVTHKFARWYPAPRGSDYTSMFRALTEQSRGAFAVTELSVARGPAY